MTSTTRCPAARKSSVDMSPRPVSCSSASSARSIASDSGRSIVVMGRSVARRDRARPRDSEGWSQGLGSPLQKASGAAARGHTRRYARRRRSDVASVLRYARRMARSTMRAFVITGARQAEVREVGVPVAGPGEVVVAVERVGLCGTDVEFFTGEMAYLASGEATYPIRIGHEWAGVVVEVGEGIDAAWTGRRVTGAGTIGLLSALIAAAAGIEIHILGRSEASLAFARSLGFDRTWSADAPPTELFDAVIDASTDAGSPSRALDLVEPGRRIVFIGLSGQPSTIDTRRLVLEDVTAVGILSASPGLDGAIDLLATGRIEPRPLVAAVVGLEDVGRVLAGERDPSWGAGPKVEVDPRR